MNWLLYKENKKASFFTVAFLFVLFSLNAQDKKNDSLPERLHSPRIATLSSALLPGSGQIYNSIGCDKQWWKRSFIKVPFIYGGFYFLGKYTIDQHYLYTGYRNAYNLMKNDDEVTKVFVNNTSYTKATVVNLRENRNRKRRSRDLGIIGISVWYILNIIDANIDAHFFYYDVSDNLSFQLMPSINNKSNEYVGLNLYVTIK